MKSKSLDEIIIIKVFIILYWPQDVVTCTVLENFITSYNIRVKCLSSITQYWNGYTMLTAFA